MQGMHLQEPDFLCNPVNATSFAPFSTFSHLQPHLQVNNGSPVYRRAASVHVWCSLGAINPTLSGPVGLTVPVDSVCATDPANTSQRCCAHGYTAQVHTHSNQAVPCYGYQTSRKPQNPPFQTGQAFRQEKRHVRKTQAYGNRSHCRTSR